MAFDAHNIRPAITAYADGELDADQIAALLDYLVAHPDWTAVLRDTQRLRAAARRVLLDTTPAVPEALRQRVASLAAEAGAPETQSPMRMTSDRLPSSVPTPQPQRWRPLAVAASIALVVGLVGGLLIPASRAPLHSTANPPPAVPVTLAAAVTRVHVDCSRFPLKNHAGLFPTTGPAAGLATSVRQAFHTDASNPDLTSLGFTYVGAGPCRLPLEGTIHLLYRAADSDRRETLSVFVQADHGQLGLAPRQVASMTPASDPHPAYVWRADGAVFFLVTDNSEIADKVRDFVQVAMAR